MEVEQGGQGNHDSVQPVQAHLGDKPVGVGSSWPTVCTKALLREVSPRGSHGFPLWKNSQPAMAFRAQPLCVLSCRLGTLW